MNFVVQLKFIILSSLIIYADATLAPPKKGERGKSAKAIKVNAGPVFQNVFDRNLVEDEPFAADIITESGTYYNDTKSRLFHGPTLGFVTPVRTLHLLLIKFFSNICLLISGTNMVTMLRRYSVLNLT